MWSKRFWILPMLIISSVVLHQLDVLHLGYLYIKSHDMKYTVLSMDYYPKDGDLFTTSETVTPGYNYEEGIISLNPDYNKLLDNDLNEIAVNREKIDSIEYEDLAFYAGPYRVHVCLDHRNVKFRDTSLFKMHANVDILGQFELYDKYGTELLYKKEGEKFWIRDSILIQGWARRELLDNKIEEIWLAQASDHVADLITSFDESYAYERTTTDLMSLLSIHKTYNGEPISSKEALRSEAEMVLFEIRRLYNNGSPTYGYHGDPNYQRLAYGTYVK